MRKVAKKKSTPHKTIKSKSSQPDLLPRIDNRSLKSLLSEVRTLVLSARQGVVTAINLLQVRTNFEIGRRIVEHEQQGATRATYGAELLRVLSERLTTEFGKGFSRSNLEYMRKFYLLWRDRLSAISQQATGKSLSSKQSQLDISQQAAGKSLFTLSWTHYVLLLGIKDEAERRFYEIEASSESWSVPELKRQVSSSLYERLALSRKKNEVRKLAAQGQVVQNAADILKEPYVLEFLGLDEQTGYSESDLEQAIINRIEHFLLELGKGFLFEARQKRFTFDEDHYFVDLVFYNRLLRCYVIIDLKIGKLTHQDIGQMQMYVNHYDREVKLPDENPTIGILLCKHKKDAIVELTLPNEANIHAREYKLYLPSRDLLKKKLIAWSNEQEGKS